MAVENAGSTLWRKGLYWQTLLFPIQAWTLWHGALRRYKKRPLFPATCYGQLVSEAFWEKQQDTDRQTDMATSPALSYQREKTERLETAVFSWLQSQALERAFPVPFTSSFSEQASSRGQHQAAGLCPKERWKKGQSRICLAHWKLLPLTARAPSSKCKYFIHNRLIMIMLEVLCARSLGELKM